MNNEFERYLGDGVYASFDGFQIWLAANHHDNKVIALEPNVFSALVDYERSVFKELAKQQSNRSAGVDGSTTVS